MARRESNNRLRQKYVELLKDFLSESGEDVDFLKSNEINLPTINDEGSEEWVTIVVRIPNGSRDGEAYDGYGEREDYKINQRLKEEKRKRDEKIKKEKIARQQKHKAAEGQK